MVVRPCFANRPGRTIWPLMYMHKTECVAGYHIKFIDANPKLFSCTKAAKEPPEIPESPRPTLSLSFCSDWNPTRKFCGGSPADGRSQGRSSGPRRIHPQQVPGQVD